MNGIANVTGTATGQGAGGGAEAARQEGEGGARRPEGNGPTSRRKFLRGSLASLASISFGGLALPLLPGAAEGAPAGPVGAAGQEYTGPNVIVIRFGGGVRRMETLDAQRTWSPYLRHELARRGVLFPRMEIASMEGLDPSHGQGTLNILTGAYDRYQDVSGQFLGERFEPKVPTVFEYLRKSFDIPEHQTLIVNGEDRPGEEFYTFSNHHLFGVDYRSNVLSLYRFKAHLIRRQLEEGRWRDGERAAKELELETMESLDRRAPGRGAPSAPIQGFWDRWRDYYGDSGLKHPRGDGLLTELAVEAMRQLRPRLMMVNYQDCDYVHWGNVNHYTRGIQIMDEGLRRIVEFADRNEHYSGRTVFIVVPDCGRDANRLRAVPCQHHFTRTSREIFALAFGAGIARGVEFDGTAQQIDVAPTIAALMGFRAVHAQGRVLEEVFA